MTGSGRGGSRRRETRHRLVAGCTLSLLTLTGCATGGGTAGQSSPTPRADLAVEATVAAENQAKRPAGHSPGPGKQRKERKSVRQEDAVEPAGTTGESGTTTPAATWRQVRLAADGARDHGSGPAYADITALRLEDDGTHLRVTVEVAGVLPGRLAADEVQGVGVDVFRFSGQESDFQIFVDGGAGGWRGFLQTPRGFVKYPGTLAVEGRTIVARLPWVALGGREDAQVSAFADWSDGRGGATADFVDRGAMSVR